MNEIFLIQDAPILRDASPLQIFLTEINRFIYNMINMIAGTRNSYSVVNQIMQDPLLVFPIGVVAIMGTIGILKRILSRD